MSFLSFRKKRSSLSWTLAAWVVSFSLSIPIFNSQMAHAARVEQPTAAEKAASRREWLQKFAESEKATYDKIYELCRLERSFTGSIYQSLKSYQFFWNGVKSLGGNPFKPSSSTQKLFENPGYWRAMKDCYQDDQFYVYSFTIGITIIDEMGSFADWVGFAWVGKLLFPIIRASRFALAFPKLFKAIGYTLVGISVSQVIIDAIRNISSIVRDHRKTKQLKQLAADPAKGFDEMWNKQLEQINRDVENALLERIDEIKAELKGTDLTREHRTKLIASQKDLEDRLDQRRQEDLERSRAAASAQKTNTPPRSPFLPSQPYYFWP